MNPIKFSADDLDLFARASGDHNPLHASSDYARKTPFGERVVFGMLDALAVLARVPEQQGMSIAKLAFDFFGAALPEVEYATEVSPGAANELFVRVADGRRPILEGSVTLRSGNPPAMA